MSSLACSHLLQKEGFEAIMHISCTNKNRIEIQSQILGADALGIKNILLVTGDHVLSGENREAKPVYDIDSIQAIKLAKKLNENNDLFIGAAANPLSGELQIKGLEKKAEAGAEFIMTQPVYDIEKFKGFIEKIKKFNINLYLIAGVMPLKSVKHAEFINDKIPGILVPDELIKRLENSKTPYNEGIIIANETIREIKKIKEISGINVMGLFDLEMAKYLEI
jgi:5,10-methylenetetrahydrofolate reductase